MRGGTDWLFRDHFGRTWRAWLASPAGPAEETRALPGRGEARKLEALAYFALGSGGSARDQVAAALLEMYEAVGGRGAQALGDGGAFGGSHAAIAPAVEREVVETLSRAIRLGRLRLEEHEPHEAVMSVRQAAAPAPPPPPVPVTSAQGNTWFELRVLDEVGDPLDGLTIRFSFSGQTRTVTTNGAGVARLDGVTGGFASATVAKRSELRAALKPRWATPRPQNVPKGPDITVRPFDDELAPVNLKSEVRGTLVITPYFRCSEIPGAHFAFARSFPTREALQQLSEIAEDLMAKDESGAPLDRKALVFGHTDRSGSEELNKELSERRAKAIYALFTHDDAAWEELFSNTKPGKYWNEKWDVWEVQHMLNALACGDAKGTPLAETGIRDARTIEAIHRFQSGDYPDKPAEQAPLPASSTLGKPGRKELFLAYAKRVSRDPVPKDSLVDVDGHKFMGCGEFNPLSLAAKDAESRRAIVMVFDGVSAPSKPLPCRIGSIKPCKGVCSPPSETPPADGKAPYRCSVYKELAERCPCQAGPDLSHDLLVRFFMNEKAADQLPHVFVLESDDATITRTQTLSADARATDDQRAELHFEHVPDWHSYRLRAQGSNPAHTVFDYTPFEKLHTLSDADQPAQVPAWLNALDPVKLA